MEKAELIMMYVPVPSKQVGVELGKEAVTRRLAACANLLGPMTSVYEWKETLCEEEEWVLVLKTTQTHKAALKQRLCEMHPYECPCLTHWPIQANPEFAAWVQDQTS